MTDDKPFGYRAPTPDAKEMIFWPLQGPIAKPVVGVPREEAEKIQGLTVAGDEEETKFASFLSEDETWSFITVEKEAAKGVEVTASFSDIPSQLIFGGFDPDGQSQLMQIRRPEQE